MSDTEQMGNHSGFGFESPFRYVRMTILVWGAVAISYEHLFLCFIQKFLDTFETLGCYCRKDDCDHGSYNNPGYDTLCTVLKE